MAASKQDLVDQQLKEILSSHGVIAFPTETVYGFGCDPFDPIALEKINEIKFRNSGEGFLVLIDHPFQVYHYATHVPKYAERFMAEYWPGAVTLIFQARDDLPFELCGPRQTIGLRLSSHEGARHIAKILPHGIVSTSANRTGDFPLTSTEDVSKKFSNQIDYIVPGDCGTGIPSTVIECIDYEPKLVRKGPVEVVGVSIPKAELQV
ncbi:L-threonylcarbamoyladenylate synthase [Bdellovibrionota bacterium]